MFKPKLKIQPSAELEDLKEEATRLLALAQHKPEDFAIFKANAAVTNFNKSILDGAHALCWLDKDGKRTMDADSIYLGEWEEVEFGVADETNGVFFRCESEKEAREVLVETINDGYENNLSLTLPEDSKDEYSDNEMKEAGYYFRSKDEAMKSADGYHHLFKITKRYDEDGDLVDEEQEEIWAA